MTDRPDPFDDLEFETAEAVDAEVAAPEALVAATAPATVQAVAPAAAEAAGSVPPAPTGPSKVVAYATLGLSAIACACTISAIIVTVAAAQPKPTPASPERAAIGRIEAMLTGQKKQLETIAAAPESEPGPGGGELAALTAVVRANQQAIEALPAAMKAQMPRGGATVVRPVIVTKPGAAASDPRVAEVLRSQAALQRQIEALAAKMAKTTTACVTQNDGQIRYP